MVYFPCFDFFPSQKAIRLFSTTCVFSLVSPCFCPHVCLHCRKHSVLFFFFVGNFFCWLCVCFFFHVYVILFLFCLTLLVFLHENNHMRTQVRSFLLVVWLAGWVGVAPGVPTMRWPPPPGSQPHRTPVQGSPRRLAGGARGPTRALGLGTGTILTAILINPNREPALFWTPGDALLISDTFL